MSVGFNEVGRTKVVYEADISNLRKGSLEAETAVRRSSGNIGEDLDQVHLSTQKVGGSMLEMSKHVLTGIGAFYGFSSAAKLIEDTVKAAQAAQVAQTSLALAVKNAGGSFGEQKPEIDKFLGSLSAMAGFTRTDLTVSLSQLINVTKNVGEAQKDLALAVDLARVKHIDLADATSLVVRAQLGLTKGMASVIGPVSKVTTNMDALKAAHDAAGKAAEAQGLKIEPLTDAQKRTAAAADKTATSTQLLARLHEASAGAAEKYGQTASGAMDKFKVATEELQVRLGTALLPVIARVANKVNDFVGDLDKSGTSANGLKLELQDLAGKAQTLGQDIGVVVGHLGGFKKVAELLIALKIASTVAGWTGSFDTLIGTSGAEAKGLKGAESSSAGLLKNMGRLAGIGVITVGLELVITHKGQIDKAGNAIDSFLNKAGGYIPGYGSSAAAGALQGGGVFGSKSVPGPSAGAVGKLTSGGVQIPTSQRSTHQTAGLAGFPAVDYFAKPGTPVLAPEDGSITRISGSEPSGPPPQGQGGPWGLSIYYVGTSGNTYYITHLFRVGQPGSYKRGEVIAIIGDYPGSSADHAHVGIHTGGPSKEATYGSTLISPGDYLARGRSGGGTPAPPKTTTTPKTSTPPPKFATTPKGSPPAPPSPTTLPGGLNLAIAQAAGTKGLADDISANEAAIRFLTGKLKGVTDKNVKADLVNAINGYKNAIIDAKKKLADARKEANAGNADFAKLDPQVEASIKTLQRYITMGVYTEKEKASIAKQIAQYHADAKKFAKGGFTEAEFKTLQAEYDRLKKIRDEGGRRVIEGIKKQKDDVAALDKGFVDEFAKVAESSGLVLQKVFTPAQIQAMGNRIAQIKKTLSGNYIDPAERKRLEGELGALTKSVDQGLEQLAQTIATDREKVAQAWTDFGDHVIAAFDEQVVNKLQTAFDKLDATFDAKRTGDSIRKASEALDKAAAGDPETAALVRQRIQLWRDYYEAIRQGNVDSAAAIQDQIIQVEDALAERTSGLVDDQQAAAAAIVSAGDDIVSGVQAQGELIKAAALKRWADLEAPERQAVLDAIKSAQGAYDSGAIALPEALDRVKAALVDHGMDPATADSLIHDPVAQSLGAAVVALDTAINTFSTAVDKLANALGLKAPALKAGADAAADAIAGPFEEAAARVRRSVDDILATAKLAANLPPGTDPAIGAAIRNQAYLDTQTGPGLNTGGTSSIGPNSVGRTVTGGFADGGEINRATMALIGEAGREWVLPEKKIPRNLRPILIPLIRQLLHGHAFTGAGNIPPGGAGRYLGDAASAAHAAAIGTHGGGGGIGTLNQTIVFPAIVDDPRPYMRRAAHAARHAFGG